MHKVELDELEINAIGAALDERRMRLSAELERLMTHPLTPGRDFAIECNLDAMRDTLRSRHAILNAIEEPEPPAEMTYKTWVFEGMEAYTEAELREVAGK